MLREWVAANGPAPVPADAACASGSRLDPHISPAIAMRRVARVAVAPQESVRAPVAGHTESR